MTDIRITIPTAKAEGCDRYMRVGITLDGSPLRYEFRYLQLENDDGTRELACMESQIGQPFEDPAVIEGANSQKLKPSPRRRRGTSSTAGKPWSERPG